MLITIGAQGLLQTEFYFECLFRKKKVELERGRIKVEILSSLVSTKRCQDMC